MANAIVYLLNNTEEDVRDFRKSYQLLEENVLPALEDTDLILLYEHDELIDIFCDFIKYERTIWKKINFSLPDYPEQIKSRIPEFYPHPTHGNGPIGWGHPGFNMGYRFMCKLFANDIFEIVKDYNYYMRLDTDSFVLSKVTYDIFKWCQDNEVYYSYIEPAVQFDHPDVSAGLNDLVGRKLKEHSIESLRPIESLEQGKIYYTNFEVCKISWFLNSVQWNWFFSIINDSGMIFIKRWGDHIIRYLGVNLFMNPQNIKPIQNFHYQHGAVYKV